MWQSLLRHCAVLTKVSEEFAPHYLAEIRHDMRQTTTTDVLTKAQIEFIAQQLPSPKATTGRPAYSNQELLPGILRVLRSGCRWRDLNLPGYPDGSTHWRRLRLWRRGLHFRRLWQRILKLLDEQKPEEKANRLKRFSIDGTLLPSFEFKEKTG